jgi:glyoxylase-like metal-dependent hydrolase (beta-lactamase superfamily II)
MSSLTLGDFEISLIRDGVYWWDGGAFFGVVPKTLWSRKMPCDEQNRVAAGFNSYLIRTGDHTILIDTGGGMRIDERSCQRMKLLQDRDPLPAVIARAGVDPEGIDVVINSHLHWDHCGGNTSDVSGRVEPAFPRAQYFAPRGEWQHAHERLLRDRVSYLDINYDPLVESGRMTLVDGDTEVAPGVWIRRAPGHTRDMTIITAESRAQTFCFLTDLAPTAAHLQPTWITAFDLYPLESIETKLRWLSAAADGQWICGFGHETEMPFAGVVRDEKAMFRAAKIDWEGRK